MATLISNAILLEQNQGKPNPERPQQVPFSYLKFLDMETKKIVEVRLPVLLSEDSFTNIPTWYQFDGFAVLGGSKGAYCIADAVHNYEPAANGSRRRAESAPAS